MSLLDKFLVLLVVIALIFRLALEIFPSFKIYLRKKYYKRDFINSQRKLINENIERNEK